MRLYLEKSALPARFHNTGDEAVVCHLAETKARKLKFLQNTSRAASELTAATKANRGGIARHLIQLHFSGLPLFVALVHIQHDFLKTLTFVPFELNEPFTSFLFCNPGFCHISLNLTIFYEQDLFVAASGLDRFY